MYLPLAEVPAARDEQSSPKKAAELPARMLKLLMTSEETMPVDLSAFAALNEGEWFYPPGACLRARAATPGSRSRRRHAPALVRCACARRRRHPPARDAPCSCAQAPSSRRRRRRRRALGRTTRRARSSTRSPSRWHSGCRGLPASRLPKPRTRPWPDVLGGEYILLVVAKHASQARARARPQSLLSQLSLQRRRTLHVKHAMACGGALCVVRDCA